MNPRNLIPAVVAPLLLATALRAPAAEVVIQQGADVDVQRFIDPAPQGQPGPSIGEDVQDLGDGTTDEGGVPDAIVDPRDAALHDEKNLGPNAPGYIP